MKSRQELFEEKYIPEPNSGCWIWTAALFKDSGYGAFGCRPVVRAHRESWRLYRGEIPDGLCVLHRCDVPACVNPDHLWLGTNAENSKDMKDKKRAAKGARNGGGVASRKLNANDVLKIRADSRSETQIAADYAVNRATIGLIKRRINWSWLP
jgi:hypothetical protein